MQSEYILNGKSLISSGIPSKWSLFNKPIVHFFLIAIAGFLVYSNTFNAPFQFDDIDNIIENYNLRDLTNFWPPSGSRWFGFLTFALNYHFGGLNVTGYHIVNLIVHIINALLVYWLVILSFKALQSIPAVIARGQSPRSNPVKSRNSDTEIATPSARNDKYIAFFSALLFASHPIQTQAVTYIVQRFTSLATMFYLLSLAGYIRSRLSTLPTTRYTLYAVSLFSAILAMKTKEISFTLPIIIVLYEFMFFEGKFKKRLLYLIPLLLIMFIIPLSLIGTDKPIGAAIGEIRETVQETAEIPRWSYLFTQFRVIVTYIRLLFLPINQNLDYDYPLYHSFFNPEVFLSFLFLLTIFSFAAYLLYTTRYPLPASRLIAFGIFWFFITLSVESSIIPIRDVIFEHRLYLPVVGIIIVFVSATFYILQAMIQNPKRSVSACCLLLATAVIVLSISTYQRNIVWQNEVTLWEDAATKSPEKARVYYNLGKIYSAKGWDDKAIENYQLATRIKPDYIEAHNNLGNAYNKKGWIDKAIEHYQIAILLGPDFIEAHNNIGNAYAAKGWIDKAIEHYWLALRLKPNFIEAHNNLGLAYERKGLLEEAIKEYQTALIINPEFKTARENLNRLLRIKGK
ncbi:MAG: tetratricopeptide repeat protein [Nitrospirae bacterium]|nr:tetratricopeptide repeat protein [Nitrospirota bacterium]